MFSGIVEEAAKVVGIEREEDNLHLTLQCSFVDELRIDQSVSHNGVCLTVVRLGDGTYTVTAIKETLLRSNLGQLEVGSLVNLERSMRIDGRLDGHIVWIRLQSAPTLWRQRAVGIIRSASVCHVRWRVADMPWSTRVRSL